VGALEATVRIIAAVTWPAAAVAGVALLRKHLGRPQGDQRLGKRHIELPGGFKYSEEYLVEDVPTTAVTIEERPTGSP
jgi:hypothetical protein